MKAFDFRLEKVLRWRETQLRVRKARVADATAEVARKQGALEALAAESAQSAASIAREPAASALHAYARFLDRARVRARQLQEQLTNAKRNLAAETDRLVEANRKLRLLENLKSGKQDEWRREFDRQTADFGDEAFLSRMHSTR